MKITFEGCRYTPSWTTLQSAIRETMGMDDETLHGRLTRIARRDRHCGYRDPGVYDVNFLTDDGEDIEVELIVK